MKAEILSLLRNSREYTSGQELCGRFGVSRTAVWKAVNQLKEEGHVIEAVHNKGYRLISSPDMLNISELKSRLQNDWAGCRIEYKEETGSTNTDAKQLAEEGAPHGTIVVADRQNAGKGRRGKSWVSPSCQNIYFTILLRPKLPPAKAPMLTLVMALSVVKALEEKYGEEIRIKWPNDVVLRGKKICGILTEMSVETDYIQYVVIGVGINVNQMDFAEEVRERATSLLLEYQKKESRSEILQAVLSSFEDCYRLFEKDLNLEGMLEDYNSRLVNCGREVCVLDPQGEWHGTSHGINKKGELQVEDQAGALQNVYAGEVSVRGIYGYV